MSTTDSDGRARIDEMLRQAGIADAPETSGSADGLRGTLSALRALAPAQVPEPSGDLAELLRAESGNPEPTVSDIERQRRAARRRNTVISLAVVGAMGIGVGGVAATDRAGRLSADSRTIHVDGRQGLDFTSGQVTGRGGAHDAGPGAVPGEGPGATGQSAAGRGVTDPDAADPDAAGADASDGTDDVAPAKAVAGHGSRGQAARAHTGAAGASTGPHATGPARGLHRVALRSRLDAPSSPTPQGTARSSARSSTRPSDTADARPGRNRPDRPGGRHAAVRADSSRGHGAGGSTQSRHRHRASAAAHHGDHGAAHGRGPGHGLIRSLFKRVGARAPDGGHVLRRVGSLERRVERRIRHGVTHLGDGVHGVEPRVEKAEHRIDETLGALLGR